MTPESKAATLARVAAIFRRMLATGKPVAIEDARWGVDMPEGFNPSCLGWIARQMQDAGEIVLYDYRRSVVGSRHSAPTRLWVLADKAPGNPGEVARG